MSFNIFGPEKVATISKVLIALVTFLIGDITTAVLALGAMLTLDYLTGVVAAAVNGEWNSTISLRGIAIKFGFLSIVGGAFQIGELLGAPQVFRKAFIVIFVVHEFGSMLENVNRMGKDQNAVPDEAIDLAEKVIDSAKN